MIADLRATLPDDAIICADPGTPCPYFSAWYEVAESRTALYSPTALMARSDTLLPPASARRSGSPTLKLSAPWVTDRFGMCVGELETIKRLNLPITAIVFSNSVFGWIKAGQKSGFGERYFSVDFTATDHAAVAAAYGVKSWRVEDPRELGSVLAAAVAHDGPTLVDIVCQPLQDSAAPVTEWVA